MAHRRTLTFIVALLCAGINARCLFDQLLDAIRFCTDVK